MTKIFIGDLPENPCTTCRQHTKDEGWRCIADDTCPSYSVYKGQQSILNKCIEVDLDNLIGDWICGYWTKGDFSKINKPFSQFLLDSIKPVE